jgi:hypothetical protein
VTLCIAAACQYRNKPRIVTCTDWKVTTGHGSAENTDKMRWVKKPNWVALTAGEKKSADELVRACRREVADEAINEDNALGKLTKIAEEHMVRRKNSYVFGLLGVTYQYFRLHWRDEFPEAIALETLIGIRQVTLGASLIVAGFVPIRTTMKPLICRINQKGEVSISDHFECIGEGSVVANPTLLRRSYDSDVSLMDAVYRLYEAKSLAEVLSSVGENTSVDLLFPDGELEQLSQKGHEKMSAMFRIFGPKSNIAKPKLEKKYWDSLDFLRLR